MWRSAAASHGRGVRGGRDEIAGPAMGAWAAVAGG